MLPSSLISWIFSILAVLSFIACVVASIIMTRILVRWYNNHTERDDELDQIIEAIKNVITDAYAKQTKAILEAIKQVGDKDEKQTNKQ